MMPGPHKRAPLCFRASEDDELWLRQFAAWNGEPVNAVLARMLTDYRAQVKEAHLAAFGSPYEPGEISR